MAEMIPDRLPSGASAGERKVFALLQQLPDEVIVYYEPVVAGRYPDFIVIIPSVGLLVIEAIAEKALGPDHPDVALPLDSLAEVYRRQGRYDKAEPHYVRAVSIYEKALGPDHPHVSIVLINLASLQRNLGRYSEAERLYKRSLAVNLQEVVHSVRTGNADVAKRQ